MACMNKLVEMQMMLQLLGHNNNANKKEIEALKKAIAKVAKNEEQLLCFFLFVLVAPLQ